MHYEFPAEIREYVRSLANLMYFANSRNNGIWAGEIYRSAQETIRLIIVQLHGLPVANSTMAYLNLGGNEDFLDDWEIAIDEALSE